MPDTKTTTSSPTRTRPDTRPEYDPDEVREPEKWCPQQRRESGWEAV